MIPLQTASPHPVTNVVFSPDGAAVAVAQPQYGVTILERGTGRTVAVCAMPRRAGYTGLTFCGAGKYLAASHAKGFEVFDASTGARVAVSLRYQFRELKLAERDGVAYGLGLRFCGPVWRPEAPTETESHFDPLSNGHNHRLWPSPDARFAVGSPSTGRRVKLHDLDAARYAAEIERPDDAETRLVARFCPVGKRFALNDGRTIDVYDTGSLSEENEDEQPADTPLVQRADGIQVEVAPMPHTVLAPVFSLKSSDNVTPWYPPFALLADGRGLLVKRPRNRVQLWDAPTGTLVNEWSWRLEWVTCVAVCADGLTAVAGGRFGRLLLWDLE